MVYDIKSKNNVKGQIIGFQGAGKYSVDIDGKILTRQEKFITQYLQN